MLKITIPELELYNEKTCEFITIPKQDIALEHSLVSISKWESKWHKSFFDEKTPRTYEEEIDYFRCMTLTQNVKPEIYRYMPSSVFKQIKDYIDDPMTATTIRETNRPPVSKKITSEEVYGWMVKLNIPFQCEKWHINRLMMLIKVCSAMNSQDKMSQEAIYKQNTELNKMRRMAAHSKG